MALPLGQAVATGATDVRLQLSLPLANLERSRVQGSVALQALQDAEQAHNEAYQVINDNRDILDKLALALLEKELEAATSTTVAATEHGDT